MVLSVDRRIVAFVRFARSRGLQVPGNRALDVVEALSHLDAGLREDVYQACQALLVSRRDELAIFDQAFRDFWGGAPGGDAAGSILPASEPGGADQVGLAQPDDAGGDATPTDAREAIGMWSDVSRLASKDFAAFTPAEMTRAAHALARLPWQPGWRRSRRWEARRGPVVDLHRAFSHSVASGGELMKLPTRRRRLRPRPLVLLCDVSGSMERYSRMLVHFAHAVARRQERVEVFLFSTALTRVTRDVRVRRLNAAAGAVARAVPDWSGGTRIGAALRELHRRWGGRVLGRGAVVLLVSDGWDRGDPDELARQMSRLRRRSSRVIWLNPLAGTPDYAPLTRGLRAALPFVDDFLPARTLRDVADLALHLGALDAR